MVRKAGGSSCRRGVNDEAGSVIIPRSNLREQDRYVSGAEWRSAGRKEERMEWSGDEHSGPSISMNTRGQEYQSSFQ
ncbi:MAG TPA: hypothetical protein PK277_09365 [Methanoregulaceae archaeon]|nr:hypothetical protein [Methanoregulaceae archaeon]